MQGSYKQEARKQYMEQEERRAVTRIRTEVAAATTQSTNHYTITASHAPGGARSALSQCWRFWPSFSPVPPGPALPWASPHRWAPTPGLSCGPARPPARQPARQPAHQPARQPARAERRPVSARFRPACRPARVFGAGCVGSGAECTCQCLSWTVRVKSVGRGHSRRRSRSPLAVFPKPAIGLHRPPLRRGHLGRG